MFLKILIITVILLSLAILGMALNILVRNKGRFPAYRVGHNRDMQKLGITCVKHEEIRCHRATMGSTPARGNATGGSVTGESPNGESLTGGADPILEHDCAGCQQSG